MENPSIEQRLNSLEATVARLQSQVAASSSNWLQEVTGIFKDDPIFDEVLAYGRELRQADCPDDEDEQVS